MVKSRLRSDSCYLYCYLIDHSAWLALGGFWGEWWRHRAFLGPAGADGAVCLTGVGVGREWWRHRAHADAPALVECISQVAGDTFAPGWSLRLLWEARAPGYIGKRADLRNM